MLFSAEGLYHNECANEHFSPLKQVSFIFFRAWSKYAPDSSANKNASKASETSGNFFLLLAISLITYFHVVLLWPQLNPIFYSGRNTKQKEEFEA